MCSLFEGHGLGLHTGRIPGSRGTTAGSGWTSRLIPPACGRVRMSWVSIHPGSCSVESTQQGLQSHVGRRGREGLRQQLQADRTGLLLPLASRRLGPGNGHVRIRWSCCN